MKVYGWALPNHRSQDLPPVSLVADAAEWGRDSGNQSTTST